MLSFRRAALILLLGSSPLLGACRQGLNQRCQVDSDCQDGLRCVIPAGGDLREGGTCQPLIPPDGGASDAGQDQGTDQGSAPDLTASPDLTP